ncbi:hypothetical protein AMAG_17053 [Allomyces macrogynus ATCC 38327]|uniref:Uncharacterized protein n=1 Tax=Allomyces macrogynus (strain ATCC 38327) TaxID=578462 RepID=A0A0L0TD55_ALLM3|nr:hypothetical protein AMAG_17053 [Allomyces macrogynus ATCC 38327]|eukprot:KNE72610.1 hypothetical protein AMAG_17053 [Allomyces macrogynus ATCC 38327]
MATTGAAAAPLPGVAGDAVGAAAPAVPAPPPLLPSGGPCRLWRTPPASPSDPGTWLVGCVRAAVGYQCGANQEFTTTPSCTMPTNWNPACVQNVDWLLPLVNTTSGVIVPINGCVSNSTSLDSFRCPTEASSVPSASGTAVIPTGIDTPCFLSTTLPQPGTAPTTTKSEAKETESISTASTKPDEHKGKSGAIASKGSQFATIRSLLVTGAIAILIWMA